MQRRACWLSWKRGTLNSRENNNQPQHDTRKGLGAHRSHPVKSAWGNHTCRVWLTELNSKRPHCFAEEKFRLTEKTSFPAQEMTVGERASNAAEALGLIERCCLAINLLVLALSFALLVTFWVGKISPISLAVVGFPLIALLAYFLVIKSDLLRWTFRKSGKTSIHLIILVVLIAGGLYLRSPTGACIHGGQDHGSYFNLLPGWQSMARMTDTISSRGRLKSKLPIRTPFDQKSIQEQRLSTRIYPWGV